MASNDLPPRFFKVYFAHLSSDSMQIPFSYEDELPDRLPKTAILQGPLGGRSWKVSVVKKEDDEVHFGKGWVKFVQDNHLKDADFLTFIYDGDRTFEVGIYRDGIKDVEEDDDEEDDEEDTETGSKMAIVPITRSKNKGKLKEKVVEDSDSDDFNEAFGRLDVSESDDSNNSDSSYSPEIEHRTASSAKAKATSSRKKGKSSELIVYEEEDTSDSSEKPKLKSKRSNKVKARILNPEAYMDDPKNIVFETSVKNRDYELLILAQTVKDYNLKFANYIRYIDEHGQVIAKATTWGDKRVVVKKWKHICRRNKLKKDDAILCELFRKQGVVYAIKLHIVRAR